MAEFETVARIGDIPEGQGRAYPVNGRMVAVYRIEGAYLAMLDACPHMGASLAGGFVEEGVVTCPWHAWRFCVRDGTWADNPKANLRTPTFEVRVVGDEIQVLVPDLMSRSTAQ
jgi:nitrite reductase (NADH) small subunit/3-phenylpropionate/trans-cinnamate dioxygenase ferredoxin subunit